MGIMCVGLGATNIDFAVWFHSECVASDASTDVVPDFSLFKSFIFSRISANLQIRYVCHRRCLFGCHAMTGLMSRCLRFLMLIIMHTIFLVFSHTKNYNFVLPFRTEHFRIDAEIASLKLSIIWNWIEVDYVITIQSITHIPSRCAIWDTNRLFWEDNSRCVARNIAIPSTRATINWYCLFKTEALHTQVLNNTMIQF